MPETNVTAIWAQALEAIRPTVTEGVFRMWFQKLTPGEAQDGVFYLIVPDRVALEMIAKRYLVMVNEAVARASGRTLNVKPVTYDMYEAERKDRQEQQKTNGPMLNPKYVFSTFVTGNSNRFAHAASLAVAESPGQAYNPLFIYGGAGLGKTHLMHAIAHYILDKKPSAKLLYLSTEAFTNQVISAIAGRSMQQFRDRYRSLDVLLLDDIQFIAGKTQTQEEFFHTFNALYESGKQIIISCDKQPREIPTLEDRMRSRFEWGLIADIQRPEMETRIAILRRKAESEGLLVPDDVNHYIAEKIDTNIRELEGCLTRVVAYSSLVQRPVCLELAQGALRDLVMTRDKRSLTPEFIMATVCSYFSVRMDDLTGKRRDREIALPRQVAMFLIRENTDCSLVHIGQLFGGRDHTTVLHGCMKITEDLKSDASLRTKVADLRKTITEL